MSCCLFRNLKKIINDIKLNNSVFENIVTNKSKLDNEIWERLAFQSKSITNDSDLEISKLNNKKFNHVIF